MKFFKKRDPAEHHGPTMEQVGAALNRAVAAALRRHKKGGVHITIENEQGISSIPPESIQVEQNTPPPAKPVEDKKPA